MPKILAAVLIPHNGTETLVDTTAALVRSLCDAGLLAEPATDGLPTSQERDLEPTPT